jgi:hypothetical protein
VCLVVNCVLCDKCVSIDVKIKCVNSSNMSDIWDKLKFTTNVTHFITHFITKHVTIFDTHDET